MDISLDEFCRRIGAGLPADGSCRRITTLLTDSRSLADPAVTAFFAISTATNDGSRYIPYLYSRGVRTFVVARGSEIPEAIASDPQTLFVEVDDPVRALQRMASRPADFAGSIIAVTGSRGKTVLKEWLYQLLEPLTPTVRSPRSFNSQIGVPLSMAEIRKDTKVAIIEAGVSRSGEMAALRDTIDPDTVIITNIGAEHDDGFPSRAAKAAEKAALASGERTRLVIYCADDAEAAAAVQPLAAKGKRLLGWTSRGADAPMRFDVTENFAERRAAIRYSFDGRESSVTVEAQSPADVQDACHALAYMLAAGYEENVIADGFRRLHPIATRLNVSEGSHGCSVVYDSYTSDFSSLPPALDFIARRRMPGQAMTVIMSDIRHESQDAESIFAAMASALAQRGVSRFVGIGAGLCAHRECFEECADAREVTWGGVDKGMITEFYPTTEAFLAARSASDFRSEIILLKGAPEYEFGRILEMLEARTHETVLEVNLDALVRNFNYFRSHVPASTGLVAMVKASGYGAGSYEIAKTLQDAGAAYLAVAVLDEGVDLRRNGITMPVMVMNPKVANYRMMFANRLEPEIYTFSMLSDVIEAARRNGIHNYPIHVKLDTGMHRMGFIESELPMLMDMINASDEVRIETVFSHLATADCPDMDDYTERQLDTFHRATEYMLSVSKRPFKRHILNSAGILRYPAHHYDFVRLGIGLYGINTLPEEMEKPLEPVSSLKTVIISVREWEAGETIGYGRKGVIKRRSRIATIPIGYADGMNRHFGNGAVRVLVNGEEAPTIGNICMDACMIDVTGIDCREGDTVEIFGPRLSVQRLADLLTTIPYEILTSVSPRVKRIYYRE